MDQPARRHRGGYSVNSAEPCLKQVDRFRSRDVAINMSIDEAEELARQLVAVVTDAREGRFSEHGVKVAEDMRVQDLKEAWLVLGIEDLNNSE